MPWREATPEDGENAYQAGCHLWTGYTDGDGQPVVRTATSQTTARRAAWERERGAIGDGRKVTPLCGERLCVRVEHLTLATTREIRYRSGATKRDRQMRRRVVRLKARGWSGRRIARALAVDEATVRRVLAGDYFDPRRAG